MSEFESMVAAIPLDENLQAEAEKLAAEGWQINPSAPPVALYYLTRARVRVEPVVRVMGAGALGELRVDDDKVFIRAPDGTIRKN
jgi:di/tripeptidase